MKNIHLTRLFEWAVNTLGSAVLWAVAASFVVAFVAAAVEPSLLWAAGIAGPLAFGSRLARAEAPMPYTQADLDQFSERQPVQDAGPLSPRRGTDSRVDGPSSSTDGTLRAVRELRPSLSRPHC